ALCAAIFFGKASRHWISPFKKGFSLPSLTRGRLDGRWTCHQGLQFTEIHRNRQFTLSMRRQPNPTERSEVPFSNFQIFKFSNSLKDKVPLGLQHSFQPLNRIRLLNLLIMPPPQNSREPCRDP